MSSRQAQKSRPRTPSKGPFCADKVCPSDKVGGEKASRHSRIRLSSAFRSRAITFIVLLCDVISRAANPGRRAVSPPNNIFQLLMQSSSRSLSSLSGPEQDQICKSRERAKRSKSGREHCKCNANKNVAVSVGRSACEAFETRTRVNCFSYHPGFWARSNHRTGLT